MTKKNPKITKELILKSLEGVKDPEVGYDIVTMGLIYDITITGKTKKNFAVEVLMTYTTPFCPWGPQLNEEVINTIKDTFKIKNVAVKITFDPPYKMPEELKATLGL